MKKIVKIFAVLTLFNIAFSSCKQDQYDIAKQNLVATHSADGPIAQAEAKLGTLEKRDVTFTDETGKSSFKMRFAAKSQKIIEAYLEENKYEFFTITASEKNEKYSKVVPRDEDKEAKSFDLLAGTNQNDVFTELISKKIEKGIVGYGVEISFKKNKLAGKNAKILDEYDGGYFFRNPPFPWIEYAEVRTKNDGTGDNSFTAQKRAWIGGWSTMFNIGFLPPAGVFAWNVDGPKWFRVGVTPSSQRYYFVARFIDFNGPQEHWSEN